MQDPQIEGIPLTVLSVNPIDEDDRSLKTIASHSNWMLHSAQDLSTALVLLDRHKIGVVLCERDLMPGTWMKMLEHLREMPNAPSLIVTSRLADERLWAEALNLGAWDVLAKPYDYQEAMRSVRLAWLHWHHNGESAHATKRAAGAS